MLPLSRRDCQRRSADRRARGQPRRLRARVLAIATVALLPVEPALADVLEIGRSGSQWIAGGPPAAHAPRDADTNSGAPATNTPVTNMSVRSIPSSSPLFRPVMTSQFGMRLHPLAGRMRMHEGIDLAATMGTPVYATADGSISFAGASGGYGVLIQIDHGGALQTRYGHLSRLGVRVGQRVQAGQLIGWSGSTGQSTGPHLHYEVRLGGRAVNPLPYLR